MTLDGTPNVGRPIDASVLRRLTAGRRPLPPGCSSEQTVRPEAIARGLAQVRAAAYLAGVEDGRTGRLGRPRCRDGLTPFLDEYQRGQADGLARLAPPARLEESSRVA